MSRVSTKNVPDWAIQVIERACEYKNRPMPSITWTNTKHYNSSGRAWPALNRMHISAGKSGVDQALCLLHEYAHLCCDPSESHSTRFWHTAFDLYAHFHLPLWHCIRSEIKYKRTAYDVVRKRFKLTPEQDIYLLGLLHARARIDVKYEPSANPDPYEIFWSSITGC
jgi:hypothetical protein